MSGNPKACRRNALECMQLAQTAQSPEAREDLAELSQTWLGLAGDIESGQALLDLLNDFEEPVRGRLKPYQRRPPIVPTVMAENSTH